MCCSELKHTFVAHGHVFELVPFSEVPCTSHAQPCMLFVDGLEVESGVKRNDYLKIVFHNACFKYFCIVGIPMFVITAMLISTSAQSGSFFLLLLAVIALMSLVYCCTCCIWANQCRSYHYKNVGDDYNLVPDAVMQAPQQSPHVAWPPADASPMVSLENKPEAAPSNSAEVNSN